MVHAYCSRSGTCSPSCLSLPILRGASRRHAEDQYDSWTEHHCSHWALWLAVHLYYVCASHLSAVTIPELILGAYLVCESEITQSDIQRSGWEIEDRQHKLDKRTDGTFNGGNTGAYGARRAGNSMAVG